MADFLIAGPILRRVTPDIVCVWLLTNRKVDLKLTVWPEKEKLPIGESDLKDIDLQRFLLGNRLFVYLLQAKPPQPEKIVPEEPKLTFPYDQFLSYRIAIVENGSEQILDLKKLKLTYGNSSDPSFFIPKNLKNILHGSCRKPHGNADEIEKALSKPLTFFASLALKIKNFFGASKEDKSRIAKSVLNYDALSLADDVLEKNYHEQSNRPSLMLLTGDQIYADDVADSIFNMVKMNGAQFLGFQELLPKYANEKFKLSFTAIIGAILRKLSELFGAKANVNKYETILFDPAQMPASGRQGLAQDHAGLSSEEAGNHLFTFGEFAAMYAYVFGNALNWEPDFAVEENYRKVALQGFHATLPKVRRLLANIPTYMIFDDHDVTDDWNITGGWYDKVRDLPLGQRVISNALATYWVFQGWGNQPDNLDPDLVKAITGYLSTDKPTTNHVDLYNLYTWKHRGWSYSMPTNPPIIVLDSRTQRQPDNTFYPPWLLDRYALDWLRIEWIKLMVQKEQDVKRGIINKMPEWPVFVATTPVMGFSPIEGLQQLLLWAITRLEDNLIVRFLEKLFRVGGAGTYYLGNILDAESWMANREGFGNFLNCLLSRMKIEKCVFLSGDVHYSFSALGFFIDNEKKQLQCWQLTSSSLSNVPRKQQAKLIGRIGRKQGHAGHNNRWAYAPAQRWRTTIQYLAKQGSDNDRIVWQPNIGLVEFDQGLPVKHSLINLTSRDVFELAKSSDD